MAFVRDRRDKSSAPIIVDSGTSPRDRPLPSPQPGSEDVSFPNAELCGVLDKIVSTPDVPPISARQFHMWQLRFFIREDRCGFFHVYPQVGGPFQSIQEADNAISRHLDGLRSPKMCTDGLSRSEICIRNTLYWPDGTRKKSSQNCPKRRNIVALVHSLLDKYNEDHHLPLDLAYKLEDVVSSGEVYESGVRSHMFCHINFTAKRQRADGSYIGDDNLFFAEVKCLKGETEEYVLNCLCAVKPNDKGRCYGCEKNGSIDLKHPTDAHKYEGGLSRSYPQCRGLGRGLGLPLKFLGHSRAYDNEEARLAAEESRIRHIYKCLDDQAFVAKLDASRIPASSVSSKREDGQGKGPRKYGIPAKLDGTTRAAPAGSFMREDAPASSFKREDAPAGSSKREDGQEKGPRKYVVPARRIEEYVVPAKLEGGSRAPPADSSKREDGWQRKYGATARQRQLGHVF